MIKQMFDLQPSLKNEHIRIQPLRDSDFETLFAVASDPLIWEQHPNKERYRKEVFENFFAGAIESGGAFLVVDTHSNQVIGSSRYYDWKMDEKSVSIGYTFLAKDHWGTTYNHALKYLMLDHAFQYVESVFFHIGALNIRSQKAIEKLGAKKVDEVNMAYYGELNNLNFIYRIDKADWTKRF